MLDEPNKKKFTELDKDIENLEKNILFLSGLLSLVAQKAGIPKKEFIRLAKRAASEAGKGHEVMRFLKIVKGIKE